MSTLKTWAVGDDVNPEYEVSITRTPPSKRDVIYDLISDKSKASVIHFTFGDSDSDDIHTMGEVFVKSLDGDAVLLIYRLEDGRLVKQITRQSIEIITKESYDVLPRKEG